MAQWERDDLVEPTDVGQYCCVDLKLVGIISFYVSATSVKDAHVEVGPSSDWLASHVNSEKRICSSFN